MEDYEKEFNKYINENKVGPTAKRRLFKEEESGRGIPKSIVGKYVNMKSLFDDKAGDPSIKAKLMPIVTDFFPKNLDISYQELEDRFGKETSIQTIRVLFGAYLDGYLDSFQEPIIRLNDELVMKYSDE